MKDFITHMSHFDVNIGKGSDIYDKVSRYAMKYLRTTEMYSSYYILMLDTSINLSQFEIDEDYDGFIHCRYYKIKNKKIIIFNKKISELERKFEVKLNMTIRISNNKYYASMDGIDMPVIECGNNLLMFIFPFEASML